MPDPSPGAEQEDVIDETLSDTTDVNDSADPSNADEGVKSYQATIDSALAGEKEEAPTSETGPDDEKSKSKDEDASDEAKAKQSEEDEKAKEDPDEAELKKYSENAQNRIRELIGRRKEVEAEVAARSQELEQLKPKAESYAKLESYMQQNNIPQEHFNNTLAITGLINTGRYDDALKVVTPIFQQLLTLTGNTMPPDLAEEVRLGKISEERARELAKARVGNQNLQETRQRESEQAKTQQEAQQLERQQEQTRQWVNTLVTTSDSWYAEKSKSDPDWKLKQDFVVQEAELQMRKLSEDPAKLPKTADETKVFLDNVMKTVEGRISAFKPKPKQVDHMNGKPVSAGAQAKPGSLMDAINQALEK